MKSLLEELSCAEEWSESLQIQSNSQRNIFSPRNIDTEIGKKIEKATISIQEIKKEIEYVRDLIETHLKKREEYLKMLDAKLDEELAEYHKDQNIEELADLIEVIYAAAKARGYSVDELEKVRVKKAEERGGFGEKVFLREVEDE